jgi:hypothetical protein
MAKPLNLVKFFNQPDSACIDVNPSTDQSEKHKAMNNASVKKKEPLVEKHLTHSSGGTGTIFDSLKWSRSLFTSSEFMTVKSSSRDMTARSWQDRSAKATQESYAYFESARLRFAVHFRNNLSPVHLGDFQDPNP